MKRLLVLSAFVFLAGCTVGPDYKAPEQSFLGKWFSRGENDKVVTAEEIKTDWWKVFNDPQLESYIQKAVAENKDIVSAQANVRRARALRQVEGASLLPEVDFSAQPKRSDSGAGASARTLYETGFDASWEVDIFGGNQRSVESADARIQSAVEMQNGVMLSVLAEVARNYYEVRGVQKRIDILKENIRLQDQTYDLVVQRYKLGESSEFDVSRARGQLDLTRSRLPDREADLKTGIYRLSVLLGQPPEALLEEMTEAKPLPAPPDVVPVGLRSDILRRRPDIRRAERELAAQTADIGVATADLFPKFFLTGSAGRGAIVISDLFLASSNAWSLAALLEWPVFNGGALRAQVKVQEAEAQAALADYEQAVLVALRDAETALTRYAEKLKTRQQLAQAVESRKQSVGFARTLFTSGEEDFLPVLDAERELTSAQDELVVSETDTVLNLITLYTALGGGWEVFAER